MTTRDLRWLHISDVHFSFSAQFDQNRLAGSLCESLPKLVQRYGAIDFVVFSGDVAQRGRAEEYNKATEFFSEILSLLSLPIDRLVIVPGNHDVDRRASNGLARSLQSRGEIDALFDGREVHQIAARQKAYADWLETFTDGLRLLRNDSTLQDPIHYEIRGQKICIWPINTASFSFDDHDCGKLIIGQRCVEQSELRKSTADLNIAVMHHLLSWISEVERSAVSALIRDGVDFILHGHLHENEVEIVSGSGGHAITLAAGAVYQGSQWPNTANICEVGEDTFTLWPLRYVATPREAWTLDTSLFPDSDNFSGVFPLKRKTEGQCFEPAQENPLQGVTSHTVADLRSESWRMQLFRTPSEGELYVEPRLFRAGDDSPYPSEDTAQMLSVSEVAQSPTNFIIESRPEYGGTVVLNRLKDECELLGVPVLLANAAELPNYKSKLEGRLSECCEAGARHKVIVLLDNFDVERDQRLISELKKTERVSRIIAISTNRGLGATANYGVDSLAFPF